MKTQYSRYQKNLARMSMLELREERSHMFELYNIALSLRYEGMKLWLLHYMNVIGAEILVAQAENR